MECRIRVRGHLDPVWRERLAGLEIAHTDGGISILSGTLPDQAALHGVLLRLINLGLPLVSLYTVEVPPRDRTSGGRDPPDTGTPAPDPPAVGGAARGGRVTSRARSWHERVEGIPMATIATNASVRSATLPIKWGRYALVGLGTIVAAVLANVLVYFLGGALVAYDPQFPPLANVSGAVLFTVVPAIVAVLLYAILLRFARRPARTFAIIAAVTFVVTLIPDFANAPALPGATGGQIAVLILMHIVAAAIITAMLTRFSSGP